MTSYAHSLSVALAMTAACVVPTLAQSRPPRPPVPAVRRIVDSLALAYIAANRAPGVSIEILRGTDTLVRTGYGFADLEQRVPASPSTLYQIGSITKQFAAAAVMRLVETDRVHLDDSLSRYINGLPTPWRRVTVRQLLNHTSGIPSMTDIGPRWTSRWREDMSTDTLIALTARDSMWFTPGSAWRYDNTAYVLVGVLLDRITGEPFPTYLEEKLLRPLGLAHSYYCDLRRVLPDRAAGYDRDSTGWHRAAYLSMTQPYSAGAMCATIDDLARWNFLLSTGKVVTPASYRAMTTPSGAAQARGYGFGLVVDTLAGRRRIHHGGGILGFTSANAYFPDDSLSVTVLTNSGSWAPDSLARNVARAALGIPVVGVSARRP